VPSDTAPEPRGDREAEPAVIAPHQRHQRDRMQALVVLARIAGRHDDVVDRAADVCAKCGNLNFAVEQESVVELGIPADAGSDVEDGHRRGEAEELECLGGVAVPIAVRGAGRAVRPFHRRRDGRPFVGTS